MAISTRTRDQRSLPTNMLVCSGTATRASSCAVAEPGMARIARRPQPRRRRRRRLSEHLKFVERPRKPDPEYCGTEDGSRGPESFYGRGRGQGGEIPLHFGRRHARPIVGGTAAFKIRVRAGARARAGTILSDCPFLLRPGVACSSGRSTTPNHVDLERRFRCGASTGGARGCWERGSRTCHWSAPPGAALLTAAAAPPATATAPAPAPASPPLRGNVVVPARSPPHSRRNMCSWRI